MNRFVILGLPLLLRHVAGWIFVVLAGSAAAQPVEIRIGVVGPPTQPLNVLFSQKFYQETVLAGYGKSYRVTLNRVTSTPVAAQLFAAGQLEIAMLAAPAISNMIEQGVAKKEEGRRVTGILGNRGCLRRCKFCADGSPLTIYGAKLRERSPSNILDEICSRRDFSG